MESTQNTLSSEIEHVKKPRRMYYFIVFILLALGWVAALELWIQPAFLKMPGYAVPRRLGLYLFPPLLAVLAAYGLRVMYVRRKLGQQEERAIKARRQEDAQQKEEEDRQTALRVQKRFTLEILSLGVAVASLEQEQLWEAVQPGTAHPLEPPEELSTSEEAHRLREAGALNRTLGWLTEEWVIPAFLAGPVPQNPLLKDVLESNLMEALDVGEILGRRFKVVVSLQDETPDALLQNVFDFMDQNPEVPAVLLVAEDGLTLRDCLRAADAPTLLGAEPDPEDGLTESVVAFLLGRKDRIEPMRAFSQLDGNSDDALKPFWERDLTVRSAGAFKTSDWLPGAWTRPLQEGFLKLPVLGCLHRPGFAEFQKQGDGARAQAFRAAWEAAHAGLQEPGEPQHLLYDFGGVTLGRRLRPLSQVMTVINPELDVFDQGINLHRGLGDVGAACPFLGLALAALATHQDGGISASVFLRRPEGASLFLVSPAPKAEEAPQDPFEVEVAHALV